jgi:hypothetical protein
MFGHEILIFGREIFIIGCEKRAADISFFMVVKYEKKKPTDDRPWAFAQC